jgi:CHASE3 domain sensor protein
VLNDDLDNESIEGSSKKNKMVLMFAILFLALFFVMLASYFWNYAFEHPKGEIQRTFEDGVRQYREQQKLGQ